MRILMHFFMLLVFFFMQPISHLSAAKTTKIYEENQLLTLIKNYANIKDYKEKTKIKFSNNFCRHTYEAIIGRLRENKRFYQKNNPYLYLTHKESKLLNIIETLEEIEKDLNLIEPSDYIGDLSLFLTQLIKKQEKILSLEPKLKKYKKDDVESIIHLFLFYKVNRYGRKVAKLYRKKKVLYEHEKTAQEIAKLSNMLDEQLSSELSEDNYNDEVGSETSTLSEIFKTFDETLTKRKEYCDNLEQFKKYQQVEYDNWNNLSVENKLLHDLIDSFSKLNIDNPPKEE